MLIAAKLQEGLRQSICENMDAGCVEAFQYFLQIVIEQNFIRFSSVKRAAGTWTGLLGDEETASDRIDEKRLRLIDCFLKDENAREQALVSKDAMEVYLSLWASGFYDLNEVLLKIQKIVQCGEALQVKVACVYMHAIPWNDFRHQVGKNILTKYRDDLSVVAGVMGVMNLWANRSDQKEVAAGYAAALCTSTIVRRASHQAFLEKKRSMSAMDVIEKLPGVIAI